MDQLWVPLLTHYTGGRVDGLRTLAHMRAIRPSVASVLIAGSTGDGWALDDRAFAELLTLVADRETFDPGVSVLVGALRGSTAAVIDRIAHAAEILKAADPTAAIAGVTVCPPIDPAAGQEAILAHYRAVLELSPWPVAVYQLPQVTGCAIAPETLAELARHPAVTMFKDSSGTDVVATAGADHGAVTLLRGAEGDYLQHLKPAGRYDGWLLSTGNAFAPVLRRVLDLRAQGAADVAERLSDTLGQGVRRLFEAAAPLPFANAFSNANRAADHILAYGAGWRSAPPPETLEGATLPFALLETAAEVVAATVGIPEQGYL